MKKLVSLNDLATHRLIQLCGCRQIRTHQVHVAQLHRSVIAFCVQEIQKGCAAVLVGEEESCRARSMLGLNIRACKDVVE